MAFVVEPVNRKPKPKSIKIRGRRYPRKESVVKARTSPAKDPTTPIQIPIKVQL